MPVVRSPVWMRIAIATPIGGSFNGRMIRRTHRAVALPRSAIRYNSAMSAQSCGTVAQWLIESRSTVVFTGAGISTESGIPDFRSPGGVWSSNDPVYFDDFIRSADARYEYWRQKALAHRHFADAQPNAGHHVLARWEQGGKLRAVVTQNIDGLHQLAGSRRVLELHGTARWVGCLECALRIESEVMVASFLERNHPPDCPECGGILKHATVSFGQSLPADVLEEALTLSQRAEVFLAIGSSLMVQPAASLPLLAKRSGGRLVIINRDPTPQDDFADAVINASIGETLSAIEACVKGLELCYDNEHS